VPAVTRVFGEAAAVGKLVDLVTEEITQISNFLLKNEAFTVGVVSDSKE